MIPRQFSLSAIALVLALLNGCAYSTRNALPAHIKSVAVPVFANKTYVSDYTRKVEVDVTQAVRNAFIQTGELKLAGREEADIVLEGTVTSINREVLRQNRFGDPAEVRYEIRARISVYDMKEAKFLLKDHLVTNVDRKSDSGGYNLQRGESENFGRNRAVEDLGRAIAREITESWPVAGKKK